MTNRKIICISCPLGCQMEVYIKAKEVAKVKGNRCKKGLEYGRQEVFFPGRILTTTVKIRNSETRLLPVRSDKPISRENLEMAMDLISKCFVEGPIEIGQVVIKNILDTGANIIASRGMLS